MIVGDVGELVIVDPKAEMNLLQFLEQAPEKRVLTPLGLEVIHRVDVEPEAITDKIIGPRRHVRPAPHYSKPCIISAAAKIARGGHFSQYPKLHTLEDLYLLHLNFVMWISIRGRWTVAMRSPARWGMISKALRSGGTGSRRSGRGP